MTTHNDDAEFWSGQWTDLMGMAATVANTADAVIEAMRGDVGLPHGATTDQAAVVIGQRIRAYNAAKNDLIDYGHAIRAALEEVAAP